MPSKLNSRVVTGLVSFVIVDSVVEFTSAERGFLLLVDSEGGLSFEAARNFEREEVANPESSISHSIAREVISGGRTIIATNAQEDSRFTEFTSVNELRLRSVISLPLKCRGAIIGALYLDNRMQQEVFTEADKELLEAFCNQAAIAISNARLLAEKEEREQQLQEGVVRIEQLNRELESANRKLEYQVEATTSELKEVKEMLLETQHELEVKYHYGNMVGVAPRMQEVFSLVDRIKDSNVPVLIQGESGTGKELIAKAIHFNSPRRKKRFAAENCAAISDTLLESELFGYVKGAFTGADKDKKGLFEVADGGTLFLDEVGDMSQEMQKKLLRVLQEGEFRRVGGKDVIHVDVRIVSASNKDLRALVEENRFRRDLYYRINVLTVDLPPLRERVEDIPFLAEHFLAEFGRTENTPPKRLRKDGMKALQEYPWPGNVRELRNVLLGVASLTERNVLTARDITSKLPVERPVVPGDGGMEEITIDEYLRRFVTKYQSKYSDTRIAQILGINRKTLWEKRRRWVLQR